jgi:hypothetical protein
VKKKEPMFQFYNLASPMGSRRSKQRRRRLKRRVYVITALAMFLLYQYSQMAALMSASNHRYFTGYDPSVEEPKKTTRTSTSYVILRDASGNVISRNTTTFSQFLPNTNEEPHQYLTDSGTTLEQAKKDREPILAILRDAGIDDLETSEILTLPTWKEVESLYGSEPVIIGLEESCKAFRSKVPLPKQRFLGISGTFNSGSTAFGISLQANCRFTSHSQNKSNDVISDSNGMLDQVPWAKHKMATEKYNHTIHNGIPKEHVLPIVLVRDPYYWMQSMCKQGYGARWDHISDKHCPNLVPNDFDRNRFKRLEDSESVMVWMGKNAKVGPSWPSLVHYWNAWYQSYIRADFPRLMIRFEDTLFHGRQVMKQVCECGGGELVSADRHVYLLDEAKWQHKHAQNNMISAMIKYGTDIGRYRNMTNADLDFAQKHLDPTLLDLFGYKLAK